MFGDAKFAAVGGGGDFVGPAPAVGEILIGDAGFEQAGRIRTGDFVINVVLVKCFLAVDGGPHRDRGLLEPGPARRHVTHREHRTPSSDQSDYRGDADESDPNPFHALTFLPFIFLGVTDSAAARASSSNPRRASLPSAGVRRASMARTRSASSTLFWSRNLAPERVTRNATRRPSRGSRVRAT